MSSGNIVVSSSQTDLNVSSITQTVSVSDDSGFLVNVEVSENIIQVTEAETTDIDVSINVVSAQFVRGLFSNVDPITYDMGSGTFGFRYDWVQDHLDPQLPLLWNDTETRLEFSFDSFGNLLPTSGITTDNLTEGTHNLYLNGSGTTDNLAEGTANLWLNGSGTTDDLQEGTANLWLNGSGNSDVLTEGDVNLFFTQTNIDNLLNRYVDLGTITTSVLGVDAANGDVFRAEVTLDFDVQVSNLQSGHGIHLLIQQDSTGNHDLVNFAKPSYYYINEKTEINPYVEGYSLYSILNAGDRYYVNISSFAPLVTEIGYTGSQGIQGTTGFTGSAGTDGCIGYTGSAGTSVEIQGSVATSSALPVPYTGDVGDGYLTTDTGHLWVWGGTSWTDAGVVRGPTGAIGFTGSQGQSITGATGFTGSKGDQGGLGFTGSQGLRGDTGYNGSTGVQGVQGFTGSKGDIGNIGLQGFTGSQGTHGFTGSLGATGYTGSRGDSYNIVGVVPGVDDLPIPYTGNVGDGYLVVSTGDLWVWSGTNWIYLGRDTGYTGSQGLQGFTGSKGNTGFNGSQGYTGSTGLFVTDAEIAPSGNLIIDLNDGSNIDAGVALGYTGSHGITGFTGSAGQDGSLGQQGFTGSQGIQGTTGFTGSIGGDGATGFTGSAGSAGSAGATGFTGSKGDLGARGYNGSKGDDGATGFTGSQGTPGEAANIGYTGSQGVAGAVGYTGSKGDTGTIGLTGFTGSLGYTGSQGPAGTVQSADAFDMYLSTAGSDITTTAGIVPFDTVRLNSNSSVFTGVTGGGGGVGKVEISADFRAIIEYSVSSENTSGDTTGAARSSSVCWLEIGSAGPGGYTEVPGSRSFMYNRMDGDYGFNTGTATVIVDLTDGDEVRVMLQNNNSQKSIRAAANGCRLTITAQAGKGDLGFTGSQGIQGAQGIQGTPGALGYTGSQGTPGVVGFTGSQGTQGTLGYTGSLGATGTDGTDGTDGNVGFTGSQGTQGITGFTGSAGTPGGGSLSSLTDVSITSPQDSQVIAYDSASGDWVNVAQSGGGGAALYQEVLDGGAPGFLTGTFAFEVDGGNSTINASGDYIYNGGTA